MARKYMDYAILTLKGMAMGAADVVPGVSGGTIAFISGIYEELITSIDNIGPSLFRVLKNEGWAAFWKRVNGNFLLALFLGIFISVLGLSKVLSWLLENHPILLWSFFFGLVTASIFLVGKEIKGWKIQHVIFLIAGAAVAFWISILPPNENVDNLPYLFLSGALAVCAMILPGISGAFILVLLGSYKTILDAVHERNLIIVATVGLGAVFGLLSFAKLLKWLFSNHRNAILAILTGFILGSLNKIWPWKKVLETKVIDGKSIDIAFQNVLPMDFVGDARLIPALLLAFAGFCLIFILERLAAKK